MLHVVLVQPQIPPNTGNIIRLCANTGARLHLVEPLGFTMDDTRLRRAGLDYHEWADVQVHATFAEAVADIPAARRFGLTNRGLHRFHDRAFSTGDALIFGSETSGLSTQIRAALGEEQLLRLPMRPPSRSLNLANAVAICVYEAWRQIGFAGAR